MEISGGIVAGTWDPKADLLQPSCVFCDYKKRIKSYFVTHEALPICILVTKLFIWAPKSIVANWGRMVEFSTKHCDSVNEDSIGELDCYFFYRIFLRIIP